VRVKIGTARLHRIRTARTGGAVRVETGAAHVHRIGAARTGRCGADENRHRPRAPHRHRMHQHRPHRDCGAAENTHRSLARATDRPPPPAVPGEWRRLV